MVLSACWSHSSESSSSFQNADTTSATSSHHSDVPLPLHMVPLALVHHMLHVLGISPLSMCKEMVLICANGTTQKTKSKFMLCLLEPFLLPSSPGFAGGSPASCCAMGVCCPAHWWGRPVILRHHVAPQAWLLVAFLRKCLCLQRLLEQQTLEQILLTPQCSAYLLFPIPSLRSALWSYPPFLCPLVWTCSAAPGFPKLLQGPSPCRSRNLNSSLQQENDSF